MRTRITHDDRAYFSVGMLSAKKYGMEWEFTHWYKLGRRAGLSISQAVGSAICEWDL